MAFVLPRSLPPVRSVITFFTATSLVIIIAGCVVAGPTRSDPSQTGPSQTVADSARNQRTAEANLRTVAEKARSYAIVTDKGHPRINAHFFGIPGLGSLSNATERSLLARIKDAGGFGRHKAYDPVLTPPSHRWETTAFTDATTASAAEHMKAATPTDQAAASPDAGDEGSGDEGSGDDGVIDYSTRVIAAGGRYLVSAVEQTSPAQKVRILLTDLHEDKTVDAQDMFTSQVDVADLAADDTGALTLGKKTASGDALTELGKQVISSLHTPVQLPEAADRRIPDYSCSLLPCVALTYDDGPGDAKTEGRLLDAAKKAQVRLTYFFLGGHVDENPGEVKRIAGAGHEIANHTYNHPQLDQTPPGLVKKQVNRTDRSLEAQGLKEPFLVRPPYGALNKRAAKSLGHPAIIWDVDSGDWRHKKPKKTISTVKRDTKPGSIVLMHSIHPTTVDAAPGVFAAVADKGLYAVTVSELFDGIKWENGGSYFCRGYSDKLCSNPEHPSVHKN